MKINNYEVGLEPLDWILGMPLSYQFEKSRSNGYLHLKDFNFKEEETVKQFLYLFSKVNAEVLHKEVNQLAEKFNAKL